MEAEGARFNRMDPENGNTSACEVVNSVTVKTRSFVSCCIFFSCMQESYETFGFYVVLPRIRSGDLFFYAYFRPFCGIVATSSGLPTSAYFRSRNSGVASLMCQVA